jgi:hypothetical protein
MASPIEIAELIVMGPSKLYDFYTCRRYFEYKDIFKIKRSSIRAVFGGVNYETG